MIKSNKTFEKILIATGIIALASGFVFLIYKNKNKTKKENIDEKNNDKKPRDIKPIVNAQPINPTTTRRPVTTNNNSGNSSNL